MEKKYSVVASRFIGKLGEGDNEIFTYEITFNRSLEHTGKFKGIEDGLNSYALTPMEKEYFVKVDVKDELPTSDGFYFVVEQQPIFNGKNLFVKSLGLFDSRRKRFMNNVSSWLKPLSSMPEQEWVSAKERIEYLKKIEIEAIAELDSLAPGTLERTAKWDFIKEISYRRQELEYITK